MAHSAGNLTTKKRSKTERNALFVAALGSTVLATVKEGFAVAPTVEPVGALLSAEGAMLFRKGPVGDVLPLDLSEDQETAGLVDAFRPLVLGQ